MPKPPRTSPVVPLDDAALDAVIGGAAIVPPDAGSGLDLPMTGGPGAGSEPPAPPPPGSPPLIPDMG